MQTNHAMRRGNASRGFTLLEVLIVVVIMAVLAAVVIPQFTDSSTSAKQSSLTHDLHVMRSQVEMYRITHLNSLPKLIDNSLPQLTSATNAAGEMGLPGTKYPFGPYIDDVPANPFDGSSKVTAVASPGKKPTAVVGSLGGWQYDTSDGSVWPNNPEYYK